MAQLSWNVSVQVTGGPSLAASAAEQPVEATDRVEVSIAPGDSDRVIELQPGAAAAIRLLVIQSSLYGPQVSFIASDGTDDSPPVTLTDRRSTRPVAPRSSRSRRAS